jgi:hypothetical protein
MIIVVCVAFVVPSGGVCLPILSCLVLRNVLEIQKSEYTALKAFGGVLQVLDFTIRAYV